MAGLVARVGDVTGNGRGVGEGAGLGWMGTGQWGEYLRIEPSSRSNTALACDGGCKSMLLMS